MSERELFEIIYPVFKYLTDVPVNFWALFLMATAPIMVFCIVPEKPQWMRFWRLVFAAGFTYVLMNLAIGTVRSQAWDNYNDCYAKSEFRYSSPERNSECRPHLETKFNDSTVVFAFGYGWILALGYVGVWELLWRIVHRKTLKKLGKRYKGRWFSNLTIGFIVASFFFYPFIALIDWLSKLVIFY